MTRPKFFNPQAGKKASTARHHVLPARKFAHVSAPVVLALLLRLLNPQKAAAENRVGVKYEIYNEDHGRTSVQTTSGFAEVGLTSTLSARASYVLDSISGATPTGTLLLDDPFGVSNGPRHLEMARPTDIRRAVNVELSQRVGRWTVSPQLAHSQESDYESWGLALNQSLDFNEKNTTLTLGISHDFDQVLDADRFAMDSGTKVRGDSKKRQIQNKDSTDLLLGVTQLLGPTTVLTANLTVGYSTGYLNDPYKKFLLIDYQGNADGDLPENRPRHKSRQVAFVSLTQYITPLNASAEASYRATHDSYGIWSHTAAFTWAQKLGQRVVIEPSVRYYQQSAADFYRRNLTGDYSDPAQNLGPIPEFLSADYRLSKLTTWTYGLKITVNVTEHFSLDVSYKRYEMFGEDDVTFASVYPKANVFTFGASVSF